jgi:hypothetical protein
MVQPDNNDFYENERETLALLEALVLSGFASQPVTPTGQQIQLRDDQVSQLKPI